MNAAVLEPKRSKRRKAIWLVPLLGFMLLLAPVVLFAGAGNPPCPGPGAATPNATTPPGGPAPGGMFAQPLKLQPGHWYRVGATDYGGPSDPTSTNSGSITVPGQSDLLAHPDSFAELSLLDSNPANVPGGQLTFSDANALNDLPYMTGLIVANNGTKKVLYKRDTGYGQGPGQTIAYRLDVWWQSAGALGVSKNAVNIALAPQLGTGGVLGQTPPGAPGAAGPNAVCDQLAATGTLQLTPGQRARILANGDAAAPQDAPRAVKLAIAAANQIHTKPYSVFADGHAVHYGPLSQMWPAYDCSGTVSYVLYRAGLHDENAQVSGDLESWGQPNPGQWITVYANSDHTFIVIAGLAFDTADFGGPNIPAGSGPRWRQDPLGNLQDGATYVARHPAGL